MSTAYSLLGAIERNRDDRLPWLVLADWVQERGYAADAARLRTATPGLHPLDLLSPDGWCEVVADVGTVGVDHLDLTQWYALGPLTDRGLDRLATVCLPYLGSLNIARGAVSDAAVLRLLRAPKFRKRWWLNWEGIDLGYRAWPRKDRALLMAHTLPAAGEYCNERCGYCVGCEIRADGREWDSVTAPPEPGAPSADRPDRDAKGAGRPGKSRRAWWGGYQVSQVQKRRRKSEG